MSETPAPIEASVPRCTFINKWGKNKGQQCSKRAAEGSGLCTWHLRKKEGTAQQGGEREGSGRKLDTKAQDEFLECYARTLHQAKSADLVGVSISTVKQWRKDPAFEERFNEAREAAVAALEGEGYRRAYVGNPRLRITPGGKVVTLTNPETGKEEPIVEYEQSDSLLMFFMKNNDRRYRERKEITGKDEGPIKIQDEAVLDLKKLSDDQLAEFEALVAIAQSSEDTSGES